jgi:hypothetical protein
MECHILSFGEDWNPHQHCCENLNLAYTVLCHLHVTSMCGVKLIIGVKIAYKMHQFKPRSEL